MRIRKRILWHSVASPPPPPPSPLDDDEDEDAVSSMAQPHEHHQGHNIVSDSSVDVGDDMSDKFSHISPSVISRNRGIGLRGNKDQRQLCVQNHRPMPESLVSTGIGRVGEDCISTREPRSPISVNQSAAHSYNAEKSAATSVSSSSSPHGWWQEEEKVFPLKKRRLSLERFVNQQLQLRKIAKLDEKKNEGEIVRAGHGGEHKNSDEMQQYGMQSKGDHDAMMRWRCNRENGRGWRCREPRLPGYSFCFYHVLCRGREARTRSHRKSQSTIPRRPLPRMGRPEFVKKWCSSTGPGAGRKRKMMMISTLLERTTPLLAFGDSNLGFSSLML